VAIPTLLHKSVFFMPFLAKSINNGLYEIPIMYITAYFIALSIKKMQIFTFFT
jgi:hypothetical protein